LDACLDRNRRCIEEANATQFRSVRNRISRKSCSALHLAVHSHTRSLAARGVPNCPTRTPGLRGGHTRSWRPFEYSASMTASKTGCSCGTIRYTSSGKGASVAVDRNCVAFASSMHRRFLSRHASKQADLYKHASLRSISLSSYNRRRRTQESSSKAPSWRPFEYSASMTASKTSCVLRRLL
jgi:hypothetical protein